MMFLERDCAEDDRCEDADHLQRLCYLFFFQAEDGIRDLTVTGVQTCALPISFQRCSVVFQCSTLECATYLQTISRKSLPCRQGIQSLCQAHFWRTLTLNQTLLIDRKSVV